MVRQALWPLMLYGDIEAGGCLEKAEIHLLRKFHINVCYNLQILRN